MRLHEHGKPVFDFKFLRKQTFCGWSGWSGIENWLFANPIFIGGVILMPFIRSKGFPLIEVLMVLVILSVSLLVLAGLMAMTTRSNSAGEHMTEAVTFAQDKLEELRATHYWGEYS